MSVLDDIKTAVAAYPHEQLTIEIVEVTWPGTGIDDEDDCSFRFQVKNAGTLNVRNLEFLIEGLGGTLVKGSGAGAQWVTSLTTSSGWFDDVPAHQPTTPVVGGGNKFHFMPKTPSAPIKDLVRISVWNWESDFNHIFDNHTSVDAAASVVYRSAVGTN